jgi:hypothetical protein
MQRPGGLDASFLHLCGLPTLDGSTVSGGSPFAKLKQR